MSKKKIIILGAGLSGLSTAWHLQRQGFCCHVFEKEAQAGGLCRSKARNGFIFDFDGHLLHFKHPYVFKLVKEWLKNNLAEHDRSAWIYSLARLTRYPFQANLFGLPPKVAKECLSDFVLAQSGCSAEKNGNFMHWIMASFGEGIAKHFMVPYNEKFWTISPSELTCDWLDGIVPVPTMREVVEGTVEESKRQLGYNARFWYPKKGGIGQLGESILKEVKNVNLNSGIIKINLAKKEIEIDSGRKEKFDFLISTIPLPDLPAHVYDLPKNMIPEFKRLRWNSIFNLNLGIETKNEMPGHWVYFPKKEVCFFRVGFPHNFSNDVAPAGKKSLYAEVSYSKHKPIDKKRIIPQILRDLKKAKILGKGDKVCVQDVNDIHYGYPIYDKNYKSAREKIFDFLSQYNIMPAGRYGGWQYMSMEDVILEGRDIAENVISKV